MIFKNLGEINLFIFDMDGLLIDSGKFAYSSYLHVSKIMNFEMSKKLYYTITGLTEQGIRKRLKEIYGCDVDVNKWRDSVNDFKKERFLRGEKIGAKKGAKDILMFAKDCSIKTVLASSNEKERVESFLKSEDLYEYFDIILTGNDVKKGKPEPEIFLKACEKAGIPKEEAIVFEDSLVGVCAAKNGNLKVVQIEDLFNELEDIDGDIKIKKDLNNYFSDVKEPDFKFIDLLDAKNYLKNRIN